MFSELELLKLNQQGVFPGPKESDEAFTLRAKSFKPKTDFSYNSALSRIEKIYQTKPTWIEIIYSKKNLLPWEAAATWIEETNQFRTCQIQLKNSILTRLYSQEEILAHEMVHAMRLGFDEKRFEEFLAYRTSPSRFRKYFGPLFSSSREIKLLFSLFLIPWLLLPLEIFLNADFKSSLFLTLPILGLGYATFRLYRSQYILNMALKNLKSAQIGNPISLILRLTDKEIEMFATDSEQIRAYAEKQKALNLRWKLIYICYF